MASAAEFDVVGVGLNAIDTLMIVPEYPPCGGKVPFEHEMLSPGGQVATAIVACARLGLRAKYIGTIGDDYRGQIQMESLRGSGVDITHVQQRKDCPNQSAYIVIDRSSGERTVFWSRPECLRISPEEITEDQIACARLLHIDGHDTPAVEHAARIAQGRGIPVTVDVDTIYPGFDRVLPYVDYLIASSTFPSSWTGIEDPLEALVVLQRQHGMKVSAMTLGEFGAVAYSEGRFFYSPAYAVECVDTTGAGDAFHGGFCYALLHEMPLLEALEFSNSVAALNCLRIGARGGLATVEEVENLRAMGAAGAVARRVDASLAARAGAGGR